MTALDLDSISRSVTKLRAVIPEDAFTAGILGSQRVGNGVVIDSAGLILTIGYLITEATDVWLTGADGREVAAHPLAYDQVTGFGLIMPLQKLDAPPMLFGSSADVRAGSEVHVLSARDFAPPQNARGELRCVRAAIGFLSCLIVRRPDTAARTGVRGRAVRSTQRHGHSRQPMAVRATIERYSHELAR